MRIYISGISGILDWNKNWNFRFLSFGTISDVYFPSEKSFGYFTITPPNNHQQSTNIPSKEDLDLLSKLKTLYNNTLYKGHKIILEIANKHYLDILKIEQSQILHQTLNPPPLLKHSKLKRKRVTHAQDMSLVTQTSKPGWTSSRFKKPVAIIKLRDPVSRKIITINPQKYKHNLWTFDVVKMPIKSISQLTWSIQDPPCAAPKSTIQTSEFVWLNDPLLSKTDKSKKPRINTYSGDANLSKERKQMLKIVSKNLFSMEEYSNTVSFEDQKGVEYDASDDDDIFDHSTKVKKPEVQRCTIYDSD